MLHVTIIAVGRCKEDYLVAACQEYAKRLGAFCRLQVVEVAQQHLPQNPSAGEVARALETEAKDILAKIPARAAVIPLCIEGKLMDSPGLAQRMQQMAGQSSHIVFVIGGSHGLDESVKKLGDLRLSLSPMTFPHQLARVMLLEQIYRCFAIGAGHKYHK